VGLAGACFLGATPERLVRLEGRFLKADCLAGSAPRGATEEEDRRLGEALLADAKERHEHALVVQAVREALAPVCSSFCAPETPGLLRMPNVQHLHTPVRGTLRGQTSILELVERLHPTPAAGGLPREAALPLIRRYEPFGRGWYAAPVGWLDALGDGEFAVAIRSALIRGQEALLYAGCGIVAASDPDREYAESCLKLRPMLWALGDRERGP
jgi:isochorismate synthase